MLEDRDYMRGEEFRPNPWRTLTAKLLITNGVVFVLQMVFARAIDWDGYFGLSYAGLRHGYLWQLLTFQFLHANLIHILLNSIGLFAFGFAVEQFLGARRFLALYLTSGVVGGLLHVLGSLVWPSHFGVLRDTLGNFYYVPVVGASAGLFGLIAAFATMFPERNLTVYLFFVFPVTVSARVLMTVFAAISVLGVLFDKSNVAHAAHAGGMLGGWLMLRFFTHQTARTRAREEQPAAPSETEHLEKEVDAILEKISSKGVHSLTNRERKILESAGKKMR